MVPSKRSASRGHTSLGMPHYVYMLCLRNGHLYVGSTDNLTRRFDEHQSGRGRRTTARFAPVELLYSESHPNRSSAVKREYQLKSNS